MATVLKVNQRHHKTAIEFERWLMGNPKASLKQKIHAFNAIADTEYRQEKQRTKPKKAQGIKRESSTKRI